MLTDSELEAMRATVVESLPDSAVVQTSAWVSDGGGGGTTGWTNAGTVACRVAPLGAGEGETADRITATGRFVFTFPAATSVTTNSRILHSGGTFNVESVRSRSWNTATRVEAIKET